MPAETIYSSSADGAIENGGPGYGGSSWATVRNLTTGQYLSSASTTENVFALLVAGRGAAFYAIRRYFLYFDMSSFPSYSSIDSLTLSIYRDDGGGDRNYYVDVVSATGIEGTGYDERGISTVNLVEP